MNQHIAHFKITYPSIGQAPDALLNKAMKEVEAKFIDPTKFNFVAIYDTYPDDDYEPEPGTVDIRVMATLNAPRKWWDFRKPPSTD